MLRSNPSADPGAKIEGRAAFVKHDAAHLPLRDWHESENPSRPEAAIHRQDAALSPANTTYFPRVCSGISRQFVEDSDWIGCALIRKRFISLI